MRDTAVSSFSARHPLKKEVPSLGCGLATFYWDNTLGFDIFRRRMLEGPHWLGILQRQDSRMKKVLFFENASRDP